jgi:hypothetical protein
MDISVSPVLLQSSSFDITSGQWMFRILRKHQLTKVCSFEVVVIITSHVQRRAEAKLRGWPEIGPDGDVLLMPCVP